MSNLPIALQLYSVRDAMETDFYGTLKKVKEMGYDGVEFAGLFDQGAAQIKAWCTEIGLTPYAAHVPRGTLMADLTGVVATYAEIGCKYIALPWADKNVELPGAPGYPALLDDIRAISAECGKYGITLLYHNHDFEFEKVDGRYKLDILYADTTPDQLQTEIDTCWARVGGEDPAAYVRKYAGRAPVVHLKDYVGSRQEGMYELIGVDRKAEETGKFEFRPVGCGVQDVAALLAAAADAGAELVVVEQDRPSIEKSSQECAKISIDNIKKIQ